MLQLFRDLFTQVRQNRFENSFRAICFAGAHREFSFDYGVLIHTLQIIDYIQTIFFALQFLLNKNRFIHIFLSLVFEITVFYICQNLIVKNFKLLDILRLEYSDGTHTPSRFDHDREIHFTFADRFQGSCG
ncbi:hypothetical protein SDC9_105170 [bioreactor metagenome]|uniref:Uncharacterized protein n=1 Tax=bioreactor metagenome TaxID=1076179 RepID=A0A645AYX4_9ZZZZ